MFKKTSVLYKLLKKTISFDEIYIIEFSEYSKQYDFLERF